MTAAHHAGRAQPGQPGPACPSAGPQARLREIAYQPSGLRARAARSGGCPCRAQPGQPCRPSGDHLARYVQAHQRGVITRQSVKDVTTGLNVPGPYVLIPPPGERATSAQDFHRGTGVVDATGARQTPKQEPGA